MYNIIKTQVEFCQIFKLPSPSAYPPPQGEVNHHRVPGRKRNHDNQVPAPRGRLPHRLLRPPLPPAANTSLP